MAIFMSGFLGGSEFVNRGRPRNENFPTHPRRSAPPESSEKTFSAQERRDRGTAEGPSRAVCEGNSGRESPEIRFPTSFVGEIPGISISGEPEFAASFRDQLILNNFLQPRAAMGSSSAGRNIRHAK